VRFFVYNDIDQMNTQERLVKITDACEWVAQKGGGVTVTTSVLWADWVKKRFSPAMSILWYAEVMQNNDGYDTFRMPDVSTWTKKVSDYLQADEAWVSSFVKQCYDGIARPRRHYLVVSFDGFDADQNGLYENHRLRRPTISWKSEEADLGELLPEAKFCIEKYSNENVPKKMPYWTKNPPVSLYEQKLISAVYDLFAAREVMKDAQ
jgi:hypothetical protein